MAFLGRERGGAGLLGEWDMVDPLQVAEALLAQTDYLAGSPTASAELYAIEREMRGLGDQARAAASPPAGFFMQSATPAPSASSSSPAISHYGSYDARLPPADEGARQAVAAAYARHAPTPGPYAYTPSHAQTLAASTPGPYATPALGTYGGAALFAAHTANAPSSGEADSRLAATMLRTLQERVRVLSDKEPGTE
ncbi:hypothetical protein T492DRAFT_480479 [Pavlovales sp. CCMP2436]|nr:hypothetical protein T492DRAFT_480479 [Pavlovales sp. CCMP2436]